MCRGLLPPRPEGEEEGEGLPASRHPDRRRRLATGEPAELERTMVRLAETNAELVALRVQLAEATALLERSRAHLAELGRRLAEERAFKERLLAAKAAVLASLAQDHRRGPYWGGRPDGAPPAS